MSSDEEDLDYLEDFLLDGEPERKRCAPKKKRKNGEPKLELVSAAKLHNFQFCPRLFMLDRRIREAGIPISYFLALYRKLTDYYDSLIPDKLNFRGVRKHVPDLLRMGPDLVHIEDIPPSELPKYLTYHDAESFAHICHSRWLPVTMNVQLVQGRRVAWHGFSYRAKKKDASKEWVRSATTNYYNRLITDGLPLLPFRDRDLSFDFEGRRYTVRYHEVRKGMVIGASKTRKRTKKSVHTHWYVTLALLGYCQMAHDNPGLRWKWGVPDEKARKWGGNEMYIDPDVEYHYYNTREDKLIDTNRSDDDLDGLRDTIDGLLEHIAYCESKNDFPPNHNSCYACKYNIENGKGTTICGQSNPKSPVMRVI